MKNKSILIIIFISTFILSYSISINYGIYNSIYCNGPKKLKISSLDENNLINKEVGWITTHGEDDNTSYSVTINDLIDLFWHQREFEFKSSFAYTVMNKDETKCLGCIYFYPPNSGMSDAASGEKSEVDISWWVTQEVYDQGFYEKLSFDIKEWVEKEWPFKKVFWANKKLPEDFHKKKFLT